MARDLNRTKVLERIVNGKVAIGIAKKMSASTMDATRPMSDATHANPTTTHSNVARSNGVNILRRSQYSHPAGASASSLRIAASLSTVRIFHVPNPRSSPSDPM